MIRKILSIVGAVLVVGFVVRIPHFIRINRFECSSQWGDCKEKIISAINTFQGKSLPEAKGEIKNILKNEKMVSDYAVQYKFPDKISVSTIEKKARVVIKNDNDGKNYLITAEGEILGTTDLSSLPVININNFISDRDKVSDQIKFAFRFVEYINKHYEYSESRIDESKLVVELPRGIQVLFPLEGDSDYLVGSFILVYNELRNKTEENENLYGINEIDLRYKNPVLRKKA